MEALLAKIKQSLPRRVFLALQRPYHFLLAYAAAVWFWFPSRRLSVIGVTGTKGKTTVVCLLHEVLSASGSAVISASSLQFRIGAVVAPNTLKMTMPGRFFISRLLRRGSAAGCRYAVLEVTSQGIIQFRHRGIGFTGAVMTNVAPEHIEAHGGFEPYLRAKLDLFWRLPRDGIAVINRDDPQSRRFAAATAAHQAFYGKKGIILGAKQWDVSDVVIGKEGIAFSVAGVPVRSPLLGEFNFYNILAAVAVGLSQGIVLKRIAAAVGRVQGVAGRMEFVARAPVAMVVDYAHTPDSLRKVYETLRSESSKFTVQSSKLICVLGAAGGGRDTWKRKEFGRIAAAYCGAIILTDEDPYDEEPMGILAEIEEGIPAADRLRPTTYQKILDRREAIAAAIGLAKAGDTVIITGKGAEPWIMGSKGSKVAWDDRRVVREALDALATASSPPPPDTEPSS